MIPRKIAFFWAGGPLPWMRYLTLQSFRRWNPDWQMSLYTSMIASSPKSWKSKEVDDQEYSGEDYLPKVGSLGVNVIGWMPPFSNLAPAHACDLFEWQLLSSSGGFYSDMDILYVKPIEPAYDATKDSDAMFCLENGEMAIGFLAASPKNPLFASVLAHSLKSYRPEAYQCAGTEAVYRAAGMWPVNLRKNLAAGVQSVSQFRQQFIGLRIGILPDETVYPYDWTQAPAIYDRTETLPQETIGIHWFGGLPSSQQRTHKWTPRSYLAYPCTFERYARTVSDAPSPVGALLPPTG